MAAHEAKLRGPYYGRFKPSSSRKRRRWKLEYVKTCVCKILGISSTNLGGIRQHASRKMVENGSKVVRAGRRHLRLTKGVRSYPLCLQSYAHLSTEQVAELHAFKGFLSAGEL